MSILSQTIKQIKTDSIKTERHELPEPVKPSKRLKKKPGPQLGIDYIEANDEGLIRLIREWRPGVKELIDKLYESVGETIPYHMKYSSELYTLKRNKGHHTYKLHSFTKPAWVAFFDLPKDLPFCEVCGDRLFWLDINDVSKCGACHTPRLDGGFGELFQKFYLKPGQAALFGVELRVELELALV